MFGLTALYALFWTVVVQRKPLFEPVAVESVLETELGRREAARQVPPIAEVARGAH